jgi:hypothetical protein
MAHSLLTAEEDQSYEQRITAAQRDRNVSWKESDAIRKARLIKQVQRAQERPEEFVNGLLTLVGSRGAEYITFDAAFSESDSDEVVAAITKYDTPEARRNLYTILRALTEIPKSWAKSAFGRFLRGTGKQKGSKYHGAGTFGSNYGWKGVEVEAIINIIAGGNSYHGAGYCDVLMNYHDMYDEISKAAHDDYEVVDIDARNYATSVDRDKKFLNQLCDILEARGLGPVPKPMPKKAKKPRKVKEFKSGDVIRKRHLRDMPLPAHVQVPIQRWDEENKQWLDGHTLEQVVIALTNYGDYEYALVNPTTKKAYPSGKLWGNRYPQRSKDDLEGATFLGTWKGTIAKKKVLKPKFQWRRAH